MLKGTGLFAWTVAALVWGGSAAGQAPSAGPPDAPVYSDRQQEDFLRRARVVRTRTTEKGITNSLRATLSDGTLTHDAHIQVVDDHRREFVTPQGIEIDFIDSWKFNVAAYRLDRMLGLGLVPVSIERRWQTAPGAFSWWVDDVLMDEQARLKAKRAPPDLPRWNEQMQRVRLFDQLIYNVDRNLGNLVITRQWRIWAIDHTRAFRGATTPRRIENVTHCDRQVLERLKQLDAESLKREIGKFVDSRRIRSLLARRDAIVKRLESLGEGAVFDRAAAAELRRELELGLGVPRRPGLPGEERPLRHLQDW